MVQAVADFEDHKGQQKRQAEAEETNLVQTGEQSVVYKAILFNKSDAILKTSSTQPILSEEDIIWCRQKKITDIKKVSALTDHDVNDVFHKTLKTLMRTAGKEISLRDQSEEKDKNKQNENNGWEDDSMKSEDGDMTLGEEFQSTKGKSKSKSSKMERMS